MSFEAHSLKPYKAFGAVYSATRNYVFLVVIRCCIIIQRLL